MMDKTTPNLDPQPIDQDDVSDTYILGRQVAHEFYSSAIQTYINAESAAAQVEADAQKVQAEKQGKDKAQSKKQTEGKAAEKSFADMMVGTMQRRQGGTEGKGPSGQKVAPEGGGGGWGDENAPEGMPSAEKETQAELGGLEEPMVDPTTAGAAGAAGVAKAGMAAGLGIMRTLPRAIAAGVVSAGTDYPIGASADAVGAVSPALALPFALTVGLLSGAGIEPIIERGILRAAAAAGKKLSPDALREQVQLMKGILANESGQVDVWHGSPHRFDKMDISKVGTGEGAQAFGYGLYFTDSKDIADYYRIKNSGKLFPPKIYQFEFDGVNYSREGGKYAKGTGEIISKEEYGKAYSAAQEKYYKDLENVGANYRAQLFPGKDPSEYTFLDWYEPVSRQQQQAIEKIQNAGIDSPVSALQKTSGRLYGIGDEMVAEGADPKAFEAFKAKAKRAIDNESPTDMEMAWRNFVKGSEEKIDWSDALQEKIWDADDVWGKVSAGSAFDGMTGEEIYRSLSVSLGSDKEASAFLKRAGIDGIRYPTESLSGKGKTSDAFNYVVFDDKDVRLVQRESGGVAEDLTKQAVIDEINKEVGGKGLRDVLDILKNQRGAVNLYLGKADPAAEQQLRQTVFKPKGADPVQNAFSEIIAKQADQFEPDTLVDEMQALAKDKRYLQEEIEAYFGEGVPGQPGLVEGKFSKWAKGQANELSALILEQTEAYRAGLRKLRRTASQRGEVELLPEGGQAPAPVKGGSKKSGIPVPETESAAAGPVQPGMVRGAREMLANTNPDITKETVGNIRLWGADLEPKFMGEIETPEDIMRVISGTHEAFADQQETARRGVRSWEETAAEAKKYRIEDILGRRMGQALNAEQVDNARTLLVSSADTLKSMAQVVRSGQANDLQKADFMRAFNVHYAIQMQLSGAAAEAGRALQIFRKVAQADDIKVGQIKDFLSASATSGVTPDKLAEAIATMESPAQVAAFVKQAKRATTWDMFIEAWINGLLSGPVTHAVNTTSNMLVSLWMIPERALAAGISKMHGGEIKGGEVTAQAFGLVHGFKDGLKLGWQALKTGESADVFNKLEARQMRSITSENVRELPLIKKLSPNALQEGGVAAQAVDLLGEVIRVPGRFLGAEDDFFKAVGYRMELNALAFRKGVAEGLEGNALTRRIQEIIADPQAQAPEVHLTAIEASRYQTFTNELGAGGKGLQTAANKIPGVKLIVPFIRTPTNILKFAAERTPLGLAMRKVRDDIAAGGARRDMALARISMGSMAMATVGAYAAAGHITGGGPSDSALRQHLLNQGWQPYSILIGNKYYSYGRLEPLGMMFGLAADAVEIMGEADETESDKIATAIVASIGKNVTSKTWLRGMSEVIHAMDDPDRYGQNYIKSLAGTVVPSAVAQIERTIDPEIADARTALDAIKARTPGFSKDLPTRRNLWGEKIQFNGALGPDIISPIFTSEKKDSPIDKELFRMKAPIRMPAKSQSFEGVQANLDAFEYEELLIRMNKIKLEATGKNLKKSLNDLVTKDPDYKALKSDDQKERMIRGYLQEAKEKALIEMLETNNELRMVVEDEHRRREALQ